MLPLSVVLYYDAAAALEFCGFAYQNPYLPSLEEVSANTFVLVMLHAFWQRHGSSSWARRCPRAACHRYPVCRTVSTSKPVLFYAIATLATLCLVTWSVMELRLGESVWVIRSRVGARWGTSIVALYLPFALLAFFLRQKNALTRRGLAFCICLAFAAALVSLPLGQRTLVLQPFLIAIVFWPKGQLCRRPCCR